MASVVQAGLEEIEREIGTGSPTDLGDAAKPGQTPARGTPRPLFSDVVATSAIRRNQKGWSRRAHSRSTCSSMTADSR